MNKRRTALEAVFVMTLIILAVPFAYSDEISVWGGDPLIDYFDYNKLVEIGSPSYTTSTWGGKTVNVVEFDGTNDWFRNISGVRDLDLHDTGGTWCAWIYPHDNTYRLIMSTGTEAGGGASTTLNLQAGTLFYNSHVGGSYQTTLFGTDTIPVNQWTFVALVVNKTTWGAELWVNSTLDASNSLFNRNPPNSSTFSLGAMKDGAYGVIGTFDGLMYCPRVYNHSLSPAEIATNFNGGLPLCQSRPTFSVVVNNATESSKRGDTINWSTTISSGGELSHCWFTHNDSGVWVNESFNNCTTPYVYTESVVVTASSGEQVCGFFTANSTIGTTKSSALSCFTPYHVAYVNVTYSNFKSVTGSNYVRELGYEGKVVNCLKTESVEFTFYVNDVAERSETHSCVLGSNANFSHTYTHGIESQFNVSVGVSSTQGLDTNLTSNTSFFADLQDPQISVSFTEPGGVFNDSSINVTYACWDSVFPDLNYSTVVFNNVSIFNDTGLSNNTILSNATVMINGNNVFFMTCSDAFSEANLSKSFVGFSAEITLWDEQDNVVFDASNLSYVHMWWGENASFYDFSGATVAKVNFSSLNDSRLRIELGYINGDIIVRYIDLELFNQISQVKVCANKDDGATLHYQQVIQSASEKWVGMKNVFTKCYILADKTKFVSENSLFVQAFSMNSLYDLYTYDGGNQVLLASIDGSIQGYTNLDTLEFGKRGLSLSVTSEALTFEKYASTMMRIDYTDLRMDNTALLVTLTRLDTSELLLSRSEFDSYDNFTLYFDWASLYNITNSTLFEIEVVSTNADETQNVITRFFNTSTSSGVLNSVFAAMLAFALVFFGLTLVASNASFGWFGVAIMLGGFVVLQLAVDTWYITFLTAMFSIVVTFILLIAMKKNVAGLFT